MTKLFKAIRSFNRKWYGKLATMTFVIAVTTAVLLVMTIFFPSLPAPVKVSSFTETNHVWSEQERQMFYHSSQGSQVMPNEWFLALEQPNSRELFLNSDYMSRFRFVADSSTVDNPSRLPIGFALDDPDPVTGIRNLGLSCALCHTALITYKGKGLRVDGAPGTFNFEPFLQELIIAVGLTSAPKPLQIFYSPGKFDRFAHRVLGEKYSDQAADALQHEVRVWFKEKVGERLQEIISNLRSNRRATPEGFGRLDALGTGGNTLYRRLALANLGVLNAPVKAFPLWYAGEYDWVQSNSSIRQPMARNIIEALAVNAYLSLPGQRPEDRFLSSVRFRQMFEMERTMGKLEAPAWPENIFGAVDRAKAERGKQVYVQYCSLCHSPKIEPSPLCGDEIAIRNKKRYFMLRIFPIKTIGTDPLDATNFATRAVDASVLGLGKDSPGPVIIQTVIGGVLRRGFRDLKLAQDKIDEWSGYRSDCWRAEQAYPARPLDGVWAAAPYLHNASVPNLYQLLLPAERRTKVFYTGNTEFDPKNVGYDTAKIPGSFELDVSLPGNSNAGHEFRNAPPGTKGVIGPELTDDQRWDLIEYLKIISEMPAAQKAAAEEPESSWAGKCWTDPYWGACKAEPLRAVQNAKP